MKFKASILSPIIARNPKLPTSNILEFTKSQIISPKSFTNAYFQKQQY